MSAIPRIHVGESLAGLRMTARAFVGIGETSERYELVNGVVVMSPSASFSHNLVAFEIGRQLGNYAVATRRAVVVHETDVMLSVSEVYRPDLMAYRAERMKGRPRRLDTPPDLIVEVLSEASRLLDLVTKLADYGGFGVREYWVIDPQTAELRCWRRKGRKLVGAPIRGQRVRSSALPGFELDLAQVREAAGLPVLKLRKR